MNRHFRFLFKTLMGLALASLLVAGIPLFNAVQDARARARATPVKSRITVWNHKCQPSGTCRFCREFKKRYLHP